MSRRASLPGAAELFRTTSVAPADVAEAPAQHPPAQHPGVGAVPPAHDAPSAPEAGAPRSSSTVPVASRSARPVRRIRAVGDQAPTGRERHDEKITVYCSPEELLGLESARLQLRAEHGLAVDRGRIVREAIAVVLADLEAKGESSTLIRRLRES